MIRHQKHVAPRRFVPHAATACAAVFALLVGGCSSPPPPETQQPIRGVPAAPATVSRLPQQLPKASQATTPLDYRFDAASHLYSENPDRIYKGVLPPLLYAVGVLQVQLDAQGRLLSMNWLRAPAHAPEVIAEIERTVRQAAPFPAPLRMGKTATYIETWLWDASGRFQLHTLTEGQSYEGDAEPTARLVDAPALHAAATTPP